MTRNNSAFNEAVAKGYKGTRTEWLAALKEANGGKWWEVLFIRTHALLSIIVAFSLIAGVVMSLMPLLINDLMLNPTPSTPMVFLCGAVLTGIYFTLKLIGRWHRSLCEGK